MFSWPIIPSFAIIHVDLWMTGKYTDSKGNISLMNDVFDTSQFVVVTPVTNVSPDTLDDFFSNIYL